MNTTAAARKALDLLGLTSATTAGLVGWAAGAQYHIPFEDRGVIVEADGSWAANVARENGRWMLDLGRQGLVPLPKPERGMHLLVPAAELVR